MVTYSYWNVSAGDFSRLTNTFIWILTWAWFWSLTLTLILASKTSGLGLALEHAVLEPIPDLCTDNRGYDCFANSAGELIGLVMCFVARRTDKRELTISKGKKGKGLGTCYSAAYESRTAAPYNLGSGSWLAWANDRLPWHIMRPSIARDGEQLDPRCSTQTYHRPNQPHCDGRESNLQPLDHKSNVLPLHYRATRATFLFPHSKLERYVRQFTPRIYVTMWWASRL